MSKKSSAVLSFYSALALSAAASVVHKELPRKLIDPEDTAIKEQALHICLNTPHNPMMPTHHNNYSGTDMGRYATPLQAGCYLGMQQMLKDERKARAQFSTLMISIGAVLSFIAFAGLSLAGRKQPPRDDNGPQAGL